MTKRRQAEVLPKGFATEELLRSYFLNMGYFVLRGVKFKFNRFDVTDVDLWLYGRPSPLSRERINVDIKNKKTPQALERIFWTKGLQLALRSTACVVATLDNRPDIRQFGLANDVTVLDGAFLSRLIKGDKGNSRRITEEDLEEQAERASIGRVGGDWKGRLQSAKSKLLSSPDFDGCNSLLSEVHYFLDQAVASGDAVAWRLCYFAVALFLINVDSLLKDHLSLDPSQRERLLAEGFRYGKRGRSYTEQVARVAAGLVGGAGEDRHHTSAVIEELQHQASGIPAEILSEFLSKSTVQSVLFSTAIELEAAAFSLEWLSPNKLSADGAAALAVLADFFGVDRKKVVRHQDQRPA